MRKPAGCHFHLDQVPKTFVTSNPFTVGGWFLDDSFREARRILVCVGNRTIICETLQRPDIRTRFDQVDPSLPAGFCQRIKTGPGLKLVRIVVETRSGRRIELFRRLLWMRPEKRVHARNDYQSWLVLDGQTNPPVPPPETGPLISILMPVYNSHERWLRQAIDSVLKQTYPRWELCIANDASTHPHIRPLLEGYRKKDPRIKVVHRPENGNISAASNSALALCSGEFVALLDHDDELVSHALAEVVTVIQAQPAVKLIYSDEDKIDRHGKRHDPYFKPDWMPDLLPAQNYFCHLSVYQTQLIRELGGFREGFEGSQDWDLALRATERIPAEAIAHIPRILYHWRAIPGSTALSQSAKDYHVSAGYRSVRDHLLRTGRRAEVLEVADGHWHIRDFLPNPPPLVSLIIPTHNREDLLRTCVESIWRQTRYPSFEIVVVDNRSNDPKTLRYLDELREQGATVIRDDGPFNYSGIHNRALAQARGEVIGFLNNDLEVITPGWLEEMVAQAMRPGIGAVGAMLFYPDDRIQHAGVVLGIAGPKLVNGVAGHAFKYFRRNARGSMNRLALVQNYSAITAACMVVRKALFEEVGGFDEENLAIAFNDVDFCLRLRRAGYRNLWTPFAQLYHHESASRGPEDNPEKIARAHREADYMRSAWGLLLDNDPAYNPNLTLVHEDFSFSWPPRTRS